MTDTLPLSAVETPAILVDLDRTAVNIDRAATYARSHGLALRPHVKTHKSERIAADQLRAGASGLTCATPAELEVMSAVSDDLLLAYPSIGVARTRHLAAVAPGVRLTVALDSRRAIDELAGAAAHAGRRINTYVEIDVGMHRVGVSDVGDAIALAHAARSDPWLDFGGIAFYPGQVREQVGEQDAALALLGARLSDVLRRFSAAGLEPPVVSGGSTPTMWRTHELAGVTEMRPGTYVYNDRTTAAIGACAWDDCALTVLATVVSTAVSGQVVIDAGTKALGREPVRGAPGEGYGALLDRPEVLVVRMSEEHGILDLGTSDWRPSVGDLVRVVPNHVCIVVHLHDLAYGIRGERVETSWPIAARGRAQPTFEEMVGRTNV